MAAAEPAPQDLLQWLKSLPVAPEYHPTVAEFQDPIAYILKIEKEASSYGICKIVPPLPAPQKRTAISNLNRSLSARSPNGDPTFTTRQQQIGLCPRRPRPVQKPVWQSGESYTLPQFEVKAKNFERTHLRRPTRHPRPLSPLEVESLFWKAVADRPFSVEYANDMPGSAFCRPPPNPSSSPSTVADTAWNMRAASRANGSLLHFMKEEIAGVTSPMVYVAMMFSWFAWHVEDHDLHSLNYLHLGASKTWYGVPRDAAFAFEEVVRVHGYGGEVNPVVTFAILGEKTTVMSPEVLIGAGIPCCRLVQNAGDFVVTFPRAYHSGFSHGFNCGEAANIATPEWLRVAKEAAIRRASINYPPMVSHFQLLYALALTLCSRVPMSIPNEPRSSRLRDKKRGEGETIVKELFVQNVIENNHLLHSLLEKGSSCVLLPHDSSDISLCSTSRLGSQVMSKPRSSLGACSYQAALEAPGSSLCEDAVLDKKMCFSHSNGLCQGRRIPSVKYGRYASNYLYASTSDPQNMETETEGKSHEDRLFDQGLFPCVTCGILSFACVAVIQPNEAAARYLMSADCNLFDDQIVGLGECGEQQYNVTDMGTDNSNLDTHSGRMEKDNKSSLFEIPVQSAEYSIEASDQREELASTALMPGISSLDLLARAYGDTSDSEDEAVQHPKMAVRSDEHDFTSSGPAKDSEVSLVMPNCQSPDIVVFDHPSSVVTTGVEASTLSSCKKPMNMQGSTTTYKGGESAVVGFRDIHGSCRPPIGTAKVHQSDCKMGEPEVRSGRFVAVTPYSDSDRFFKKQTRPSMQICDKDSSRMHIFCLEHAVEVEKQLRPLGGLHILILCHPDYPKVEAQAKSLAEELGINYQWKDVDFREATVDDKEKIQSALDDEEAIPGNGDWAVKLGVNLYYSANLSKSPLYSKQMPYNAVLYGAFGCSSPAGSPTKPTVVERRPGRQKKIVVAGKWCGKVWMSNQVHPLLANRDSQEQHPFVVPHDQDSDKKSEGNMDLREHENCYSTERNSLPSVTTVEKKAGRKKRKVYEDADSKKAKSPEVENTIKAVDDSLESPLLSNRRILRSRLKHEQVDCTDTYVKEEVEGGPSTRLRRRPSKLKEVKARLKQADENHVKKKKKKKKKKKAACSTEVVVKDEEAEYQCDVEGCSMGFSTKHDLMLHKRNICSVKGCGKKLFSHKYLVQHRRVHLDDRPLKCPWKGCKMTFKWAWARTEHIRVHTGARPYVCREPGCGQTFRFVSDFSRHKRKTGHSVKKGKT